MRLRSATIKGLARLDHYLLLFEQSFDRMAGRKVDLGGHHCRFLAGPHEFGVRPRAKRESKRIEQDRLSSARFAGQHAKSLLKLEVELLDQHNITDRKLPQHAQSLGGTALADPLRARTRRITRRWPSAAVVGPGVALRGGAAGDRRAWLGS